MNSSTVALCGVTKRYGRSPALDSVDLTLGVGITGLLGPNGAGKTTTIEILEGFRRRSAGRVRVLDADPDNATAHWRARVGIVLQSWRDHGRWRVRELLGYLGVVLRRPFHGPDRPALGRG